MGIYDRDYYRRPAPRGGFAAFSMWSVTTWLILINVAVFLLDMMLRRYEVPPELQGHIHELPREILYYLPTTQPLHDWGFFSMTKAVYQLQLWRFLTFQFLHANLNHLIGNMFSLFLFGPIVEAHFGSRRYVAFYLLCGVAGAFTYMLLLVMHILLGNPSIPLVGASAGIFGVLIAAAMIAPNVEIVFLFPPIPVQIKYLALIMMAVAAYTVFNGGMNAGGEAAHLGGGVVGYLLVRYQQVLNVVTPGGRRMRMRTQFRDWSRDPDH
jgi:membrane associated rhomboid family serine protease